MRLTIDIPDELVDLFIGYLENFCSDLEWMGDLEDDEIKVIGLVRGWVENIRHDQKGRIE